MAAAIEPTGRRRQRHADSATVSKIGREVFRRRRRIVHAPQQPVAEPNRAR